MNDRQKEAIKDYRAIVQQVFEATMANDKKFDYKQAEAARKAARACANDFDPEELQNVDALHWSLMARLDEIIERQNAVDEKLNHQEKGNTIVAYLVTLYATFWVGTHAFHGLMWAINSLWLPVY